MTTELLSTSRMVIAYHGCDIAVAQKVIENQGHLVPSSNPYDWLGNGIYFFEDDPLRALQFAETVASHPDRQYSLTKIEQPAVIGAVIYLGNCLDFTKQSGIAAFHQIYKKLIEEMPAGYCLPKNKRAYPEDNDLILHHLDRVVINHLHGKRSRDGHVPYDTVRGFFYQGEPFVTDSAIGRLSHIQIAVRDLACILGYFHPSTLPENLDRGIADVPSYPYKQISPRAR